MQVIVLGQHKPLGIFPYQSSKLQYSRQDTSLSSCAQHRRSQLSQALHPRKRLLIKSKGWLSYDLLIYPEFASKNANVLRSLEQLSNLIERFSRLYQCHVQPVNNSMNGNTRHESFQFVHRDLAQELPVSTLKQIKDVLILGGTRGFHNRKIDAILPLRTFHLSEIIESNEGTQRSEHSPPDVASGASTFKTLCTSNG